MMADSVEAASKSLKEPSSTIIDEFVEKIINNQMAQGLHLQTFEYNAIFHLALHY